MLDAHFVINSTNIDDAVRRAAERALPEHTQIEIRMTNRSQDGKATIHLETRGATGLAKSIHIDELAARAIKVAHQAESDETEQEALDRCVELSGSLTE